MLLVSDATNREGLLSNMYLLQRWFPVMLSVTQTGDVKARVWWRAGDLRLGSEQHVSAAHACSAA